MIKEFREFITRGNVIDLAVGIIIGGAFTAIIGSLVKDIIMPIIGILIGGVDFSGIVITVGSAQVMVGVFLNAVVQFLIIAFAVFLLIKSINRMSKMGKKKEEAPAPTTPPPPTTEELTLQALNRLNVILDKMSDEPKG
ncbi:MAG: large conductance mechanosensitive channel protein MscL [bacterium]|nr:large conductance mechanosensitive channel protein MscL [bacterium]